MVTENKSTSPNLTGVYILLLTGALAGLIICLLFLLLWPFDWVYLFIFLLSAGVLYWTISRLIQGYQATSKNKRLQIKSGAIARMSTWDFPEQQWQTYLQWRKKFNWREVKIMTIWAVVVTAVLFYFVFPSSQSIVLSLLIALLEGLLFGSVIGGLFYWGYDIRMKNISASKVGQVIFTENIILVNDLLIDFNYMGSKLDDIEIIHKDGWDLIQVTLLTEMEDKSNIQKYLVPIPATFLDDALKIVNTYKLQLAD